MTKRFLRGEVPLETTISPNYQDVLCGMLARSPICFSRSAHYEPFIIDDQRAEYAMTNKGLGMTIDVWRYIGPEAEKGARPKRYLAPLNCRSTIDNKAAAVILLHEGEESYVRTDPHELAPFHDEVSKTDLWELIPRKRLYVRQIEEHSGTPKDLLQSIYHFTFRATYAIRLRKFYEYPSGSYITSRILDYEDIYRDSNHLTVAKRSFQMLILVVIADMEMVLCVSTFNNFFALSMYVKSDFPKMTDILDEAEANLKQATDTVHLEFPEQNLVVKARIRPKPTLDDEAEIIEKSVQLDIDCQTYDYFDPFDEWDLLPEHLNPEWRPVLQHQESRRRYPPSPSSLPYQEPPTERGYLPETL
ncbi:hypothetical protein F4813DRAFT_192473 [Daldinia decipiens]|uniref:uncharacterized protein n=1 Tax=Daldinia decipiens TaxID=326647 RepID=UPI0020C56B25|nr:uncharacterized protein F4813DRAFT_192473 [Daldinia decipiens]KAI1654947.1 hypothetical protein F4813DRAFT_192473 [Daldinia decipiens]